MGPLRWSVLNLACLFIRELISNELISAGSSPFATACWPLAVGRWPLTVDLHCGVRQFMPIAAPAFHGISLRYFAIVVFAMKHHFGGCPLRHTKRMRVGARSWSAALAAGRVRRGAPPVDVLEYRPSMSIVALCTVP